MRLNSVRARTLLVLALICVAIVSILGGIWLYTASQNIKKTISSTDLHDSGLIAYNVLMYLKSLETPVALAAREPDTVYALRENNSSLARAGLDGLAASTPQDDVAFLVDRNGTLLYRTGRASDRSLASAPIDLNKNATYVTGTYYSGEFGDYVFAVAAPVLENGSVIGYIYDEVRPGDLYSSTVSVKGDYIDQLILVDGTGTIIQQDNGASMERHADLSSYTPVKMALGGGAGVVEHVGLDGRIPYVSAYYPVPDAGWAVIISTRADAAYRTMGPNVARILGVSVLFIMALTIFGYFASTYLISPIERLSRTMQKVSDGDYSVSIRAGRDDEIGDLQRAFNSLVEEIKKRDERIRTEKDRSEFYLDLMSHDINNLNHTGMGYLELAMGDIKGRIDDNDLALIGKAYETLKNSSELIANVRRIQKVQASIPTPGELDMGQLLAAAKDKYARYPGRDITINYSPASCKVRACGLFEEVLSNIVGNAIKHSDPSMPLTLNMALAGEKINGKDFCRASIEDDGPGIPDDMKEAVFTRSQRGATGARGRGLGLYIVRILVEEYGGKVWAEDRVPGDHTKGTRFVIIIPAAP